MPEQRRRRRRLGRALAVLVVACLGWLASAGAGAQTDAPAPIHWAYAPYFGTGSYRAENAEKILTLSVRPGRELRESALSEDGRRAVGLRLRFPVALSVHSLDTTAPLSAFRLDNLSTISAVPGVEVEIPMNERWTLKTLSYVGWGKRLDSEDSAWIYWGGIRSALDFGQGKLRWTLVNGLTGVGYKPRGLPSDRVFPLLTGIDFSRPLPRRSLGGDRLYLNWHVAHTRYLDDVDFGLPDADGTPLRIGREWELGLSVGKRERKIRIGPFGIERIGVAYRFNAGGDIKGIRLIVSSLFDR